MSKHGVWFNLTKHIQIHNDVIEQYGWLIKSGEQGYRINSTHLEDGGIELTHKITFTTHDDYRVQIFKWTQLSEEYPPQYGLTVRFRYNCLSLKSSYRLMYHSAHSKIYNARAPWHFRPHRHEFDGQVAKISVYSDDFRPEGERDRKYTWKDFPAELEFLGHENWPFVSEFLEEVSNLK